VKPVLGLVVAAALSAVSPLPTLAAQESSSGPGIDSVEVVTVTAVVDKIDLEKRKVTLTLENGKTKTYKVDKVAKNLDQVQPGDHVKITATEELMVAVNKSGENPAAASVGEVSVAPRGSKPGAVMVETTAMSGKVLAINSEKRKVTLLDADGKRKTVKVKSGVDLSRLAVGDSVDAVLTESVAINVTK
jgi:Cu/Ag efflux protein CusF